MARGSVQDARRSSIRGGGYRHGLCYRFSVPTSTSAQIMIFSNWYFANLSCVTVSWWVSSILFGGRLPAAADLIII